MLYNYYNEVVFFKNNLIILFFNNFSYNEIVHTSNDDKYHISFSNVWIWIVNQQGNNRVRYGIKTKPACDNQSDRSHSLNSAEGSQYPTLGGLSESQLTSCGSNTLSTNAMSHPWSTSN